MGKLFDKFGHQSEEIVPSGKERPAGLPKTVTAMTVNAEKLAERAEAAEVEAARLREELDQLQAVTSQGEASAEAIERTQLAVKQAQEAAEKARAAIERAEQAETEVKSLRRRLRARFTDLHEIPGRRRHKTAEEYAELKANIRRVGLISPIDVEIREDGGYNIVAGHHRRDILEELFLEGAPDFFPDVEIHVVESESINSDEKAFYSNLFQPSLPDYEKYLGFCMIKSRNPGMTHEEIADLAGVSRQLITKLMAFAALPSPALEILKSNIGALGANAASELAALTKSGKTDRVIEAIGLLVEGKLEQTQAVKFAKTLAEPTQKAKPEQVKIKSGKATYCSLRRADKVIRLEFKSAEDAAALQEAIQTLLESKAKE